MVCMVHRILGFVIFFSLLVFPQSPIKAKIGVFVNDAGKLQLLKSNDKMKVGTQFRVCIQSLEKEYIYAIYRDNSFTYLLNKTNSTTIYEADKSIFLPSKSEFYSIDDKSPNIRVLVICSKTKIDDIEKTFAGQKKIATSEWTGYEEKLINSRKNISEPSAKPFSIAGNVRGVGGDNVFDKLPVLSGKELFIRKYEIEVQK